MVPDIHVGWWLALAAVAGALLGAWLAEARRSARAAARIRAGARAEREAEKLLRRRGYRVLAAQVEGTGTVWVDGEALTFTVRADFLVQRWFKRYVVEVKSGERAPDPMHGPTRRQLREYCQVFGVPCVLLVDMESRRISRVEL